MSEEALSHHPRLYVSAAALAQLAQPPRWSALQTATEKVAADAEHFATLPPLTYARGAHNALLSRAREVQGRIATLLVRWYQTGHTRFREAAVTHVRQMGEWAYWSWIAMRAGEVVKIDVEIDGTHRSVVLQSDLFPVSSRDTQDA